MSDVQAIQSEAGLGISRRSLMEAAGALLCLVGAAQAQTQAQTPPRTPSQTQPPPSKPGGGRQPLFQHDLPDLTIKGWSVTAIEVKYAPGQASPAHRHPGITIACVLEGEVVSKIGDGPEKTYRVGEMFLETPGQLHGVSRNASTTQPARLLAILMAEKGVPLTTPAD